VKIDLEESIVGIHRFLNLLIVANVVETYRVLYFDQPDEMHLDGIYPDGVLFPSADSTSVVVNIIWRDDIIGPTDISIQHDDIYGSIFMTPGFFEPTDSELYGDEIDSDEIYIRAHVDINEIATDILRNLIYTEEDTEEDYKEDYEEYYKEDYKEDYEEYYKEDYEEYYKEY
jgi:hypothetical protein